MIARVVKLLEENNVNTLNALAKKIGVSLNKIKNISSGRTTLAALSRERTRYSVFPKHSAILAEFIGVVLGDGNIFRFARCQRLTISCNSEYEDYVRHVACLTRRIFGKSPIITKRSNANCCEVRIYLQNIDKALKLPIGNKIRNSVKVPRWVFAKRQYLIKCLKGLFETDGHYGLSKKYNVEYFQFCNKSESLLRSAFRGLKSLGYTPQFGSNYIRLGRKKEIRRFIAQMHFERPFPALAN